MNKHIAPGLILTALIIWIACSNKSGYDCFCKRITNYPVNPNTTTPEGIRADTSGFEIDLAWLDEQTASLEQCLGIDIDRTGFVVKIAPDWRVSPCTGAEVFPCAIDPAVCLAAQPEPDPECPCACGGVVQPPNILVITPNLIAYRHELIHLTTRAVHGDPEFACENPELN